MICAIINAQTIEKNYSFSQPTIQTIRGYEQLQFDGCMQSALAGQPSLPWQSVSLLLPEGQEAESIEVILSGFVEMEGNHQLFPYQPSRTTNDVASRELVKDETLYASKTTYPAKNHGVVTTQYKNGYGFAFSAFTPVQYIPATGQVMYATKATVRVNLTASKADHQSMLWSTPAIKNSIRRLAQNPEMMETYQTRGRELTAYDLLIITTADYVETYNEYREYYNSIGLRNRIVTLSEIYNAMTGVDNQDKIRNYIIQEYQNNGIMMVVLGGDVNLVPYRGLYCYVTSGGGDQEDNGIPSDLYFSALDGTWNDNGNNRWGEPGEDDLLPEIGISRMPFNNINEFNAIVHKSFSYQQNPVLGEFRHIVLAGEHLYDSPNSNGSDYLELLIGTHDDNGYTTTCYPSDYNFTKLYEEEGNWSGSNLRQAINSGVGYVHHDGHANSSYVAGWYTISNSDFNGANGSTHNYTFFHTQGCDCGAFDQSCILEKMVTIDNFAVAVIGNSRYGWFNEGQTEGPGAHLEREMTDAQFHDRIGLLGCAISEGKSMTAPWVTAPGQWEEGALRWNFYDMNVLGDGAVSVWIDEPFQATVDYPAQVVIGTQSIEVSVADNNGVGQKNFRCSIYIEDELVAEGVTDENGVAEIVFEGGLQTVGEMKMKVTGVNAWPQEVEMMSVHSNTPYVVYDSYTLNGGEQLEYGGNYQFNLTLKNVGNVTANNVTMTMTCDSEYITITQPTANAGTINGSQNITLSNAVAIQVSDEVPNNTLVRFNISCTDGTETWESHFSARVFAPMFELVSANLETSEGYLSPGDNGIVHFVFKNSGGASAPSALFEVYNSHPEISIANTEWSFNNLAPDQEFTADMSFSVSASAVVGALYELPYAVHHGHYDLQSSFYIPVGRSVETFETGDFSAFDWQQGSIVTAWEVVTHAAYEGSYCARSAAIGDYESSVLYIDIETGIDSQVSFFYKVSSEASYDKLRFKIDGTEKGNWSGEVDWTQASYPLAAGAHRLQWEYTKDVMMESGQDCAWIDNIVFPASQMIALTQEVNSNSPVLYPNPNNGSFSISLPEEDCEIIVTNSFGQVLYRQSHASGLTTLNLHELSQGMYFVTVHSASQNSTQKFVKE